MTPAFRSIGLGCALVWLGASWLPASAYTVSRTAGSLKDVASTFAPAANAPRSEWRMAGTPGGIDAGGPASQLKPASAPSTVFRVAEVPQARMAVTQELLTSLKAQQTERHAIVVALPADVLFDFDKADLRPDGRSVLEKAAELLKSYPNAPVEIHGHTDGKGTDGYNDALSSRRAEAVAARLRPVMADGRTLAVAGHGKKQPVAPNVHSDGSDDAEGRQRNRRVEIIIQPPPVGSRKS
ncbi:OmpA family protein [Polaromonas sp.]|uniref:OmpA family protein n=1 Tax=Polaromonas sp. TaxID=1869339 RepID=UPI003529E6BF